MPIYVYFNGQILSIVFKQLLLLQRFLGKNAKIVFLGKNGSESSFYKIDV